MWQSYSKCNRGVEKFTLVKRHSIKLIWERPSLYDSPHTGHRWHSYEEVNKSLYQNVIFPCFRELILERNTVIVLWESLQSRAPFSREHRIHTGEKSFRGNKCEKADKHSPVLIQHKRNHTGRMPCKFHKFEKKTTFILGFKLIEPQRRQIMYVNSMGRPSGSCQPHTEHQTILCTHRS